jgi:hypothetical protein
MQNLDHHAPRELHLLGNVDLRHSAAAEAMQHAISVSRGAAQARELFVRLLEWSAPELGQRIVTPNAHRR